MATRRFKDFGIKIERKAFSGDKIKIDRVFNREITVHDYKIEDSKYTGKRLVLQISIGEASHIVFTGSVMLMDMIQKVEKNEFPFTTIIVKDNDRFEFT